MNGEEKEGDPIEDTGDPLFGADEGADTETGGGRAADDTPDEPTRKVRLPSSCGLTVLVDVRAQTRSPAELGRLRHHSSTPGGGVSRRGPTIRSGVAQAAMATHAGRAATFKLAIPANGRADGIPVPGSSGLQRPSPGLTLEAHARPYKIAEPDEATTRRHDHGGQSAQGNDSLLRRRHLHLSGSP